MNLKKFIIVILLMLVNTVCFGYETDGSFCAPQNRDTIKTRQTRFLNLLKKEGKEGKEKKEKKEEKKNQKPQKTTPTHTPQEKTDIGKQLPSEFPKNYRQEVEAYYERQEFHEKVLRKLINTRNYVSFSTNMMFDAVLIPNITAEFTILPKVSLSATWMHSWWALKSSDIFWRVQGGDITARYWFGKKSEKRRLTGHHIGIYGQILSYDIDLGGQAQLTDGWNYAAGIEYGHSFVIAKNFNIDVYAGVGLLAGKYKDYSNIDGHYVWQVSVNRNTIFPTKLGASLVWILPLKKKSILYEE